MTQYTSSIRSVHTDIYMVISGVYGNHQSYITSEFEHENLIIYLTYFFYALISII